MEHEQNEVKVESQSPAARKNGLNRKFSWEFNLRQFTMFFALIGIWIIFYFLTKGIFLSTRNISNLFLQSATVSVVAMGMVLVIVTGHIDLSVGSFVGLIGAIAGVSMRIYKLDPLIAIAVCLIVGVAIGSWHGFWIAYQKIPAFIVTLASMLILKGLSLGILKGETQSHLPESFLEIGQGYLLNFGLFKNDSTFLLAVIIAVLAVAMELKARSERRKYGFNILPMGLQLLKVLLVVLGIALIFYILISYLGIPYAILLVMLIAVILQIVSNNSVFGRQLFAIGGNTEAARLSGIDIRKKIFLLFGMMGLLTSVASIVYTSRLGAATISSGVLLELDAIAAAVIGGASLSGGIGTIPGAIVGALVMSSLDNGMSLMNLYVTYQYVVKGLILLLAVWSDIALRNKQAL